VKVIVNVDGGARGNPGPAAVAAVVSDADGVVLDEQSRTIGNATNNEAEYQAVLLGIERARELGATEIKLIGDSELIVRQVCGEYRVKKVHLKPLHAAVLEALEPFDSWAIESVPRERNTSADGLVNEALDDLGQ
jgi:ribonuclease HI